MFESLKTLWKKSKTRCRIMINSPVSWRKRLPDWEGELQRQPDNSDVQKTLMLTYNRALSVYAKSKSHRQDIDALFLQIDNLRNIIRRNI